MWTWLAVGVVAYLAFLAGVIVLLRAARARSRAERAADAGELGVRSAADEPAPAPAPERAAPSAEAHADAMRGHPVSDESAGPARSTGSGPSLPPSSPTSRARG
ncbi:hypothetical protein [Embleya sp. AB8]|uniref:hypothetical protein n=1 Tax=Embleya sp. AB8 TaxID=3156304 RepID=UPI003C76F736